MKRHDDTQRTLYALVDGGLNVREAAQKAGISERTAHRWLKAREERNTRTRVPGPRRRGALAGSGRGGRPAPPPMDCYGRRLNPDGSLRRDPSSVLDWFWWEDPHDPARQGTLRAIRDRLAVLRPGSDVDDPRMILAVQASNDPLLQALWARLEAA